MITREQKEYLLPKAYNAAIRAGAAILDIYNSGGPIDVDIKSDRSPITVADRLAHSVIREYLGQTRPPPSQEGRGNDSHAERKDWDLFWMVDPLDGTVEFIKGNGEFTVNIASWPTTARLRGDIRTVPQTDILFRLRPRRLPLLQYRGRPRSGIRLCGDYRRSRSAPPDRLPQPSAEGGRQPFAQRRGDRPPSGGATEKTSRTQRCCNRGVPTNSA